MKKKIKISNEFTIPEEFIGISSQSKDYSLAYEINKILKIDLTILRTDFITKAKEKEDFDIILYSYNSERGYYYLLKNRSGGISIIPKLNHIDYLMIIEDSKKDLEAVSKSLSTYRSVLGAFKIKLDKQQTDFLKKILMK